MATRITSRLSGSIRTGEAGDARDAGARRIVGNAGLLLVGRVVAIATGLITLPLIARTLGTENFGVWTAALAYVQIFSGVTEFGLQNAATMKMSADPDHEADWLGALTSLRTIFATVAAILCAAGIPIFLDSAGDVQVVALILVTMIPIGGAQALMSVFQSRLQGSIPLLLGFAQNILWISTVTTLAIVGSGPVLFAAAYMTMLGIIAVIQVRIARGHARVAWRGAGERWRGLLKIAVPVGLGGVFITIYYKLDAVLLYALSTPEETGFYGAAYRFLDPLTFLPASVMMALLPVVAANYDADRARVHRLVQRCADAMALLSFPALGVTLVAADPIIHVLFGDGYSRTADVLPILMAAFIPICYGNLAGYLAPIVGLQWRITIYAFIGALVNVGLNVLLIPHYGALGSAWATLATEALTMSLLLGTALRRMHLRLHLGRIGSAVLATGVMMKAMQIVYPLGLIPCLAAGGVAYVGALFALGIVTVDELKTLREG